MDIQVIENQIDGIEAALAAENKNRDKFIDAKGVQAQEETLRIEVVTKKSQLEGRKQDLSDLKSQKSAAVSESCKSICDSMTEVLPHGTPFFKIDDGNVSIGWNKMVTGSKVFEDTPYSGLSGGEKVAFDGALGHALDADMLLYEAAEADGDNLLSLLEKLTDAPTQSIVSTCHGPETDPAGWDVVRL